MLRKNLHMRKLSTEDLSQYDELLRYAFQVTESELSEYGWQSDEIRQSKFPVLKRASVLGYFDGDTLVSQFAVYPLKMNIHGSISPIGFITSVATYPEYSGLGLMSGLMKKSLEDMRAQGQNLALLYPYSIPLYRKRGWEIISDKLSFRIPDRQLPQNLMSPGFVRRVPEDSPDMMAVHTRYVDQTHGGLYRTQLAWEEYWRWDVDDTNVAVYFDVEERPQGYMVYLIGEDIMHIKELIYLSAEARRGLWQYIGAHESMVNEVRGNNYTGEPMAFLLPDSDIKETIRPYIMGRIVDARAFLPNYPFVPPRQPVRLTLQIDDPFLEWNRGPLTLDLAPNGQVGLSDEPAERCLRLDIGTLTTMLLGYKRPAYLHRIERFDADEGTLKLLDDILPDEKPSIADYI